MLLISILDIVLKAYHYGIFLSSKNEAVVMSYGAEHHNKQWNKKKNLTKQTQSHLQAFSEIFIDCLSLTTELSRVHSSKQDPKL